MKISGNSVVLCCKPQIHKVSNHTPLTQVSETLRKSLYYNLFWPILHDDPVEFVLTYFMPHFHYLLDLLFFRSRSDSPSHVSCLNLLYWCSSARLPHHATSKRSSWKISTNKYQLQHQLLPQQPPSGWGTPRHRVYFLLSFVSPDPCQFKPCSLCSPPVPPTFIPAALCHVCKLLWTELQHCCTGAAESSTSIKRH